MPGDEICIRFSPAEALVLFEWLARVDDAQVAPIEHPAEQKLLWLLEAQLEKQVPVFAPNYKQLVEDARIIVSFRRAILIFIIGLSRPFAESSQIMKNSSKLSGDLQRKLVHSLDVNFEASA
jgi:hypothetical protein